MEFYCSFTCFLRLSNFEMPRERERERGRERERKEEKRERRKYASLKRRSFLWMGEGCFEEEGEEEKKRKRKKRAVNLLRVFLLLTLSLIIILIEAAFIHISFCSRQTTTAHIY